RQHRLVVAGDIGRELRHLAGAGADRIEHPPQIGIGLVHLIGKARRQPAARILAALAGDHDNAPAAGRNDGVAVAIRRRIVETGLTMVSLTFVSCAAAGGRVFMMKTAAADIAALIANIKSSWSHRVTRMRLPDYDERRLRFVTR